MQVPLLDLRSQYETIKNEILEVTAQVFEEQQFILGARVAALEKELAAYCRSPYALGVSSGTDALLVCLMAAGVGPGDEVITTPYTFFATVGSIARMGATPVFVDIEKDTYNLDPQGLLARVTKKTKAIMPVHLYGQCCDMESVLAVARERGLFVIEDAAQAIGAEFRGRRAGSMGDMGCFSFFPSKNLGAFGDGGFVTTRSETLFQALHSLRVHGSGPKYYHKMLGGNFRLDALQAAIVQVKLARLDAWTAARQQNAGRYGQLFSGQGLLDRVHVPTETDGRHVYNQFVISVSKGRDALREHLTASGIGTEVYYPIPMHLQPCFSYLNRKKGDFPVAEWAAEHTLALPVYPELTYDQQAYVVERISDFYDG